MTMLNLHGIGFPRKYYQCTVCQQLHWEGEPEFTLHILQQSKQGVLIGIREAPITYGQST